MNADNVYDHPAVSWEKAKLAYDQIQRREGELLTHWVELGTQLSQLRKSFPADQDFGAACEYHNIDLNRQYRKAAMWWAGLSPDQRDTLRDYYPDSLHPASLLNRCREQFPQWLTSTRAGVNSVYTEASTPAISENIPELVSLPEETADETEQKYDVLEESVEKDQQPQSPIRLDRRTPLVKTLGLDIATVIFNHWTNENTRNCFNALCNIPGGTKILKRIALMVPSLGNPTNISTQRSRSSQAGVTPSNSFSHRVFVPGLPAVWARHYGTEWTNLRAIKVILDQVPDAISMNQELGDLADMGACQTWWKTRDRRPSQAPATTTHGPDLAAFQTATVEEHMVKPAHGAEEQEIKVHGVKIWPVEHDDYEFLDAWAAFHFWQDLTRHEIGLKDEGAASRGRFLMEMKAWLQYASPRFANAFHKIAAAEHSHPNQHEATFGPPKHFKTK